MSGDTKDCETKKDIIDGMREKLEDTLLTATKETETEKPVIRDVVKINEIVMTTTRKIQKVIDDSAEPLHERQAWLIRSRVINAVFQMHYGMSIQAAENLIRKEDPDGERS